MSGIIETRPGVIAFTAEPGTTARQILETDVDGNVWLEVVTRGVYSSAGEWFTCDQVVRYPLSGKPRISYTRPGGQYIPAASEGGIAGGAA